MIPRGSRFLVSVAGLDMVAKVTNRTVRRLARAGTKGTTRLAETDLASDGASVANKLVKLPKEIAIFLLQLPGDDTVVNFLQIPWNAERVF